MNGYYKLVTTLLSKQGFVYYRNGKGSHEIWVKTDKNGKLLGRIQVPRHLDSKAFANKLLRDADISEAIA